METLNGDYFGQSDGSRSADQINSMPVVGADDEEVAQALTGTLMEGRAVNIPDGDNPIPLMLNGVEGDVRLTCGDVYKCWDPGSGGKKPKGYKPGSDRGKRGGNGNRGRSQEEEGRTDFIRLLRNGDNRAGRPGHGCN